RTNLVRPAESLVADAFSRSRSEEAGPDGLTQDVRDVVQQATNIIRSWADAGFPGVPEDAGGPTTAPADGTPTDSTTTSTIDSATESPTETAPRRPRKLRKRRPMVLSETHGLSKGRVKKAVLLTVPRAKVTTWGSRKLPPSPMREGVFYGTAPDTSQFTKLGPKTITDYAAVHDAVMTEADYKAIKLSAARSVTPLPNGRPGAPSHKPPWLTRAWSSPWVEHITEVRDGIPTTYRVELPSFMRPGAVNRLVHGLGSQAAARWGAGRGLNEQFEPLPQVGVGGTWSRLLVKLSQQHEFYNLRFVGINEDGNSQRNASGQRLGSNTETATTGVAFRFLGSLIPNRVSDWAARIKSALGFGVESEKGLIEDIGPGEKQVNQRGAPM